MTTKEDTRAERLESMRATVASMEKSGAAARSIGAMKGRVTRLENDLGLKPGEDIKADINEEASTGQPVGESQTTAKEFDEVQNEQLQEDQEPEVEVEVESEDEAKSAEKTPREKKPHANAQFTLCLCGCGGSNSEKAKFIQGHDAKLKGMLIKIEKGKMVEADLPDISRAFLAEFGSKCECCGQPLMGPGPLGPVCKSGKCQCSKAAAASATIDDTPANAEAPAEEVEAE